jgi:hypothetical protein
MFVAAEYKKGGEVVSLSPSHLRIRHYLASIMSIIAIAAFSSAAPSSAWTYQDIYSSSVQITGHEDFTALLVKNHVATSGRSWTDVDDGDIHLDGDGVLITWLCHGIPLVVGLQRLGLHLVQPR